MSNSQQLAHGLHPGTVLGNRYELLRFLGRGGFGRVFHARDRLLDIDVAVKFLDPHLAEDEEQSARFKREILLGRKVRHENACQIFDFGEVDGYKFISMEFVEGSSLKDWLEADPPPDLDQLLNAVAQVCAALDVAHRQGIVHRDLKLENLMLDRTGNVKVMDFGIAHSAETANMTSSNNLMGTPLYMAPERWRGDNPEAPSDIYALGVLMYHLFTGRPPFESTDFLVICYNHVNDPPPTALSLNPSLPPALAAIMERCLEKDPQRRYLDAAELGRAIAQVVSDGYEAVLPASLGTLPTPGGSAGGDTTQEGVSGEDEGRGSFLVPLLLGVVGLLVLVGGLLVLVVVLRTEPIVDNPPKPTPLVEPTPGSTLPQPTAAPPTPDPRLAEARSEAQALFDRQVLISEDGTLDALRAYQRVLQLQPFDPEAMRRIGEIAASYRKEGDAAFDRKDYEQAVENYARAMKADPAALDLRQKFEATMERRKLAASVNQLLDDARRALTRFEPRQAQDLLAAVLQADPENAEVAELEPEVRSKLEAVQLLESARQQVAAGDVEAAAATMLQLGAEFPTWLEAKELSLEIGRLREKAAREAKQRAEDEARRKAEEQAKQEAREREQRETEERAKREAEERAKREAEERAKREAEERAKREAEARAKTPKPTPVPDGWATEAARNLQALEAMLREVDQLTAAGDFSKALGVLKKAEEQFGRDPGLNARVTDRRRDVVAQAQAAAVEAPTKTVALAETATIQFLVRPWAQVRVDGRLVGTVPFPPVKLTPGEHEIILENAELAARVQKRITVRAGQTLLIDEDLRFGWLEIEPQPVARAAWRELPDGAFQDVGQTPSKVRVPAGRDLELSLEAGGQTFRFQLRVPGGGRFTFRKALAVP